MMSNAWGGVVVLLVTQLGCGTPSRERPVPSVSSPATTAPPVVSASAAPPCPPAPADDLPTGAPSRFAVIRALVGAAALPLAEGKYCDGVIPLPQATVGDWLAYNLAQMTDAQTQSLVVSCKSASPGWTCDVVTAVCNNSTNVLWNWGMRLDVDDDGKLRPQTLWCLGSG